MSKPSYPSNGVDNREAGLICSECGWLLKSAFANSGYAHHDAERQHAESGCSSAHDPRCISLTDSEFNDRCDCETLRLIDAHSPTDSAETNVECVSAFCDAPKPHAAHEGIHDRPTILEERPVSEDRTVHCTIVPVGGGRIEIVRYDRAGKWWYEDGKRRRPLSLTEAVAFAAKDRPAVIWHEGRPGGRAFDAKVRMARGISATFGREIEPSGSEEDHA